jgi:hypothetical protein
VLTAPPFSDGTSGEGSAEHPTVAIIPATILSAILVAEAGQYTPFM